MTTVQKLIEETRARAQNREQQKVEYIQQLNELLDGCKGPRGNRLGIQYYPSAYNGEKVTFGMLQGDDQNISSLFNSLMGSGMVEQFFKRLTETELPLHMNGQYLDHKEMILGWGRR